MYMSNVTLKRGPVFFKLLRLKKGHDGYLAHQALWNLFPNDGSKKRDFLFQKIENHELPEFLVLSETKPVEVEGMSVIIKPYDPKLFTGQTLAFSLVVNPVIARKKEGKKHSVKHDIWMDAKKRAMENKIENNEISSYCEKAVKEWFSAKGKSNGFCIKPENISLDGYVQNRFYKKNGYIRYSSIHLEGHLTVTDPVLFKNLLFKGIGRSKAFGCGLMLVRRPFCNIHNMEAEL